MDEAYKAPALEKGLAILECLAGENAPLKMVEIARRLGRSHNEIYRMVLVLERRGYLLRAADDRLILSDRLMDLAMRNPMRRNLHDAALPVMHRLANTLWQSCHLVVLSGLEIVVVARVESPDLAGFAVRVGYRRPIWRSTSGLALFGSQSQDKRRLLLEQLHETEVNPQILVGMHEPVAGLRKQKYLVRESQAVDSITDIAVPIFERGIGPDAIACLTVPFVSGSTVHLSLKSSIEFVKNAGQEISAAL